MRAIDTNLLVRAIIRDDPAQADIADNVMIAGDALILPTVLVETMWVLRSRYKLTRTAAAQALLTLCGQRGVQVASEKAVMMALDAYGRAGDFADLLHAALAVEAGAGVMVTFDRSFTVPTGLPLALELV